MAALAALAPWQPWPRLWGRLAGFHSSWALLAQAWALLGTLGYVIY